MTDIAIGCVLSIWLILHYTVHVCCRQIFSTNPFAVTSFVSWFCFGESELLSHVSCTMWNTQNGRLHLKPPQWAIQAICSYKEIELIYLAWRTSFVDYYPDGNDKGCGKIIDLDIIFWKVRVNIFLSEKSIPLLPKNRNSSSGHALNTELSLLHTSSKLCRQ